MNKWLASLKAFLASRRALFTSKRALGIVAIVLVLATAGTAIEFATHTGVAPSRRVPNHDSETDHEQLNAAPLSSTGSCGVERWSVKTGTDADAGLINLNSTTPTTIASLIALPAPATLPSNNRIQPTETTVFQLQDTLTEYKLETDSDYHLVLADGSGNTMIVEIPDPACVGSTSPLLPGIQTARSEFDARYTPNGSFQTVNVPVTVTGVGFFDYLHGQTGVAPNGIELHAVLDIQFGSGSPTPTPAPSTPTPTPAPTGSLTNGGFETGTFSGWTTSGASTSISTSSHTGTYAGQAGSTSATNGDSSIAQTFTAPTGASSLSFWYKVVCPDTVTYDWATATLKDNTSSTTTTPLADTCSNTGAWSQVTASVTAGHSYTLTLTSHDDNYSADPTYTLFDDVAIATSGSPTPTPIPPTPTPTPVPPTPTPAPTGGITNGGFETGTFSGWTTSGASTSISTTAHSGTYSAMAGSTTATNGDSSISQTFTAPSGSPTLGFWYEVVCPDTVTYDWATATLKDNTINTTTTILAQTCTNTGTWSQVTKSLYPGDSYTLTLTSHDDNYSADPTYTLFDDVTVG